MPTVALNIKDLMKLIGGELNTEWLIEVLRANKCSVEMVQGDDMILEVTSDRPDLFSAEGIARALRSYLGLREINHEEYLAREYSGVEVLVSESVRDVRPFIACAIVKNVKLDDEAIRQVMQLQEKLHMTYGLKRKNASIGLYDLDSIKPPIIYEARRPSDIRFRPLDEKREMRGDEILKYTSKGAEYGWIISGFDRYPLLRDSEGRVLSMPPIINSEETKVTTNTRNVFIDITGLSEKTLNQALAVLVAALVDRGGKAFSVKVVYGDRVVATPIDISKEMSLRLSRVNEVLGVNLSKEDVAKLLTKMGYVVRTEEDTLVCKTSPYRVDVISDVDVIEDVAIAYGYDKFEFEYPPVVTIGKLHPKSLFNRKLREIMVGFGFQEIYTYVLSSRSVLMQLGVFDKAIKLGNPVSSEYEVLRCDLTSKLLHFLSLNKHLEHPQKVFEIGDVVVLNEERRPVNETHLACAISDFEVSFEEIQAVLYALFEILGLEPRLEPWEEELFIRGRCAKVFVNERDVGLLGEISPEVLEKLELEYPVALMEVNVDKLQQAIEESGKL